MESSQEEVPLGQVTVVALPEGMLLSTRRGQFFLRTTVGTPSREIDPSAAFLLVPPPAGTEAIPRHSPVTAR